MVLLIGSKVLEAQRSIHAPKIPGSGWLTVSQTAPWQNHSKNPHLAHDMIFRFNYYSTYAKQRCLCTHLLLQHIYEALSATDRVGLNTNQVLINISTYDLDLNSYLRCSMMTLTWPPLVLGVVEEQGLRQSSGGSHRYVPSRNQTR
jgi:hypothetical protein